MAIIPVAALAVGNIIAVVHEQPGSDHAITSVVDPAVFLVVTLADYPNFTVRVATLLVLPGKPISPEDRPFKPDVPMTFTAAAVPTVALVTETGLELLTAAQIKFGLKPLIRDGPAKDFGKGPHASVQDAAAVIAGKRMNVVTPGGGGGKSRLDGYEVVSMDGKVLACTSKGEGQKRLATLDATVRLMDAERLLLVVKDLQYDDKFFRGRFAHYAKDTAALPKTHPMKSAGSWSRLGKMQVLQPAKSASLQAFVLGKLDAYDYSETAWEDLAETDVPFVPWAKDSTRPGKWQLRVYVKALEGLLVLLFNPVFAGTFDALIAQLDSDDYPFRNFFDLLAAVLVWAMIAQVFHDIKNEPVSNGRPISTPTEIRTVLVAATASLVDDMLNFRGDWSRMPHHDFFMHEGRYSMIAFRTAKRKTDATDDPKRDGKKPKTDKGLADLNTTGELNMGATELTPEATKKNLTLAAAQKKADAAAKKAAKTKKAAAKGGAAPVAKVPRAAKTWCIFEVASQCKATSNGAPISCTRGAACFGKHPVTLNDLSVAEAHAALAAITSIGTAKRTVMTDAFNAAEARKDFK